MKKTIAALALLAASTQVSAMPRPPGGEQPIFVKTCVQLYKGQDKSLYGGCDASRNNKHSSKKLLENGCLANQVAISFENESPIRACMPPGIVQL